MRIPWSPLAGSVLALCLTSGCGPALNPFYTNADLHEDPRIEGRWADGNDAWQIKLDNTSKTGHDGGPYWITSCEPECKDAPFPATLFRVGGTLFLDFQEAHKDQLYSSALYPHGVLRIRFRDASHVEVASLDENTLRDLLEQKRLGGGLTYLTLQSRLLLTSPSSKLQQFLARYAGDPQVWGDVVVLEKQDSTSGILPSASGGW